MTGGSGSLRSAWTVTGRIMSISSWLRMWQCHTYSQPKSVMTFAMGAIGLPLASVLLNPASVPFGPFTEPLAPMGIIGLSGRLLSGTPKGRTGTMGRTATMVSSSGLTRTVSFQPSSFGSGGMMMLSQVTLLRTWTSYRWKCSGWVSTPLCVIFQICVPSAAELIGVTSRLLGNPVASRVSVAGLTNGYRMMFCSSGVAPGASRPMFAVIRPHSSKLAEFISSWMPLGCKGIPSCAPVPSLFGPRVSNLKTSPPCWLIRA